MPSTRNPASLTPDERARELARLLANGLVRLGTSLLAPQSPLTAGTEDPSNSETNELAVPPGKSVTGLSGYWVQPG